MKYRAEIDGLRALAVIPVVFFHAGISFFSGGFIGVDIFFVISGYLITSIIIDELSDGRFSITRFYERRARRILPALFVMLAFCIVCAGLWVFPKELMRFSRSILSVLFFYSNFYFMDHSGYFDLSSDLQPLLHTWSLAVEEQFYLIFPLLLAAIWRFGRRFAFFTILTFALISLAVCQWASVEAPNANFYLAPTRAWELLAGSLCAFILSNRAVFRSSVLSTIGLAMTLFALFVFDENMPLPSLYTLVPVIGVCLIILFAEADTLTARILSIKPLVGVGLISYSVYLWHQPLLVFARIGSLFTPSTSKMIGLALLSFVIGYVSWRFIEQPFRRKPNPLLSSRNAVFRMSGITMVLFAAICGVLIATHGLPTRLPEKVNHILAAKEDRNPHQKDCLIDYNAGQPMNPSNLPPQNCVFPNGAKRIDVAIFGDSHADAISGALINSLENEGISSTEITVGGCLPLFNRSAPENKCESTLQSVKHYLINSDIPVIVIAARYSLMVSGTNFDNTVGGSEPSFHSNYTFDNPICRENSQACRNQNAFHEIYQDIATLIEAGKRVVLVYPVPEAGWNVPETYAKANLVGSADELSYPIAAYEKRYGETVSFLNSINDPNIFRVEPAAIFCDALVSEKCVQAQGDRIYYSDDNHLSNEGARLLTPEIVNQVKQALSASSYTSRH